jgi:hypothetical protein
MPDAEVAMRVGRSRIVVSEQGWALKVPVFRPANHHPKL